MLFLSLRSVLTAKMISLFFLSTLTLVAGASDTRTPDGALLETTRFSTSIPYEEWLSRAYSTGGADSLDPRPDLARVRSYYTPALYNAMNGEADIEVERIAYSSDGFRIRGFKVAPRNLSAPTPIIVWCRGGVGDIGRLTLGDLMVMSNWARSGYIVLSTQYRGAGGSEGQDEDGGSDVHDVLNLVKLAVHLPHSNPQRIFLYGYSRGGMMVYQALAQNIPVRAAVINSGVSDFAGMERRPDAKEMEDLVRHAVPRFEEEKRTGFSSRSAIKWADKLHTPIFILHGTRDWRVSPMDALHMAEALQQAGRDYDLQMVSGGAHVELNGDQHALDETILGYFATH